MIGKAEIKMVVEIICVGTEILMGNIVNTNAAYLAAKCAGLGLSCYYQSVVGDNEGRLYEAIKIAYGRSDVVILSGGLGPTQDDLTKETAAKVLNKGLYMHEPSKEAIIRIYQNNLHGNNKFYSTEEVGAFLSVLTATMRFAFFMGFPPCRCLYAHYSTCVNSFQIRIFVCNLPKLLRFSRYA